MRRRFFLAALALVLPLRLAQASDGKWVAASSASLGNARAVELRVAGQIIRVTSADGERDELRVLRVDFPYIWGRNLAGGDEVRINLRQVTEVKVFVLGLQKFSLAGHKARLHLANGEKVEFRLRCFDGIRLWGRAGSRRIGVPAGQIVKGLAYAKSPLFPRRWVDKSRVFSVGASKVLPLCPARPEPAVAARTVSTPSAPSPVEKQEAEALLRLVQEDRRAALPVLRHALREDPSPCVRVQAARLIGVLQTEHAVPDLRRAVQTDTSPAVRQDAKEALSRIALGQIPRPPSHHQTLLKRAEISRRWRKSTMGLTIAAGAVGLFLVQLELAADSYNRGRYEPNEFSCAGFALIGSALAIGLPATLVLHSRVKHHEGELLRHRVFSVGPASLQGPEGQVPGIQVAGRW